MMKKQLQKLGMALALPFTMLNSVVNAQCPTINSVNVASGPNGKIYTTVNLDPSYTGTTVLSMCTYLGEILNNVTPTLFNNHLICETFTANSSTFSQTLIATSNGNYNIEITAFSGNSVCPQSSSFNNYQISNVIDSTNSCYRITDAFIFEGMNNWYDSLPHHSVVNAHIYYSYTGIVSPSHSITLTCPPGYTISPNVYGAGHSGFHIEKNDPNQIYPLGGSFTLTLTDPTNTVCPNDVYVSPAIQQTSCYANASYLMYADSTNAGAYNLYNYSSSTGTTSYLWNFGDGSTSTLAYPTHTYAAAGFYTVCLTVTSSDGCSDTQCMVGGFKVSANGLMTKIVVKNPNATVGIDEQNMANSLIAYPNPISDELTIQIDANNTSTLIYSISDALGKIVIQNKLTDAKTIINTTNFNNGFYLLNILNEKGQVLRTNKLVK